MIDDLMNCKCGATPEIYTRFPVQKQMFRAEAICPACGAYVQTKRWYWNRKDAIYDVIEEWNKMQMKTKEQLEAELDEKIQKGDITIEEAEMEWQDYMHRGEDRREW